MLSRVNESLERKCGVIFGGDDRFESNKVKVVHGNEATLSYRYSGIRAFGSIAIGIGHKTVLEIQAS